LDIPALRLALQAWYDVAKRDLPWRRTHDPYRIWISEVMLQQTRVAAVIPYYDRFLSRFPDIEALAAAPEQDLLAAWSGLGYYSRARNLQKAATQMPGTFPSSYDAILMLPGAGSYTAAAVASIAFDLPHAVVDGNVLRVLSRLFNDAGDISSMSTRKRFQTMADALVDTATPGRWNQAVMELGAMVCLPDKPQCLLCPVNGFCEARKAGRQDRLPFKTRKAKQVRAERTLLIVRNGTRILVWQRDPSARHLGGFWELPQLQQLDNATIKSKLASFRHSIMNTSYTFFVVEADVAEKPEDMHWLTMEEIDVRPASTTTLKALRILK